MKKIVILGASGMLGSAVYNVLKDDYELILTARNREKIELLERGYGGTARHNFVSFDALKSYQDYADKTGGSSTYLESVLTEFSEVDYVINAIGLTIPFAKKNEALTLFINGALPHILARELGSKFIHITTDCAFNGTQGFPYDENSVKTPTDLYGLSKSIGEPERCLTLRTSIIGRELHGYNGLLEWFRQQRGKTISGYDGHYWNGITTKQFGLICKAIIDDPGKYPMSGIYHVFSNVVSKYEMLLAFRERFDIDCNIERDQEKKLNRTLATVKELNGLLNIPSFEEMLRDIDEFVSESNPVVSAIAQRVR